MTTPAAAPPTAPAMVAFAAAEAIVIEASRRLPSETVPLVEALGRILAADIVSDIDMPPFDKAAMDGYACRRAELAGELLVVDEIAAGAWPRGPIGPGECARIMTGAPVPEGADCVVMVEETTTVDGRVRFHGAKSATNICRRAEDLHTGEIVLRRGELVTPAHVAVMATVGHVRVCVAERPRVTVISTGDELVEPDARPERAAIRNSNGPQLCAQLARLGIAGRYAGIVRDEETAIAAALETALGASDLVVLSGGVSAGDLDLVEPAFRRLGGQVLFSSVAMQPGRPTVFGRRGSAIFCGLPGNPVSSFVVFELLLRPLLLRMMGHDRRPSLVAAVLAKPVAVRRRDRQLTVPVRFTEPGVVTPVGYHGSAHINALTQADALLTLTAGAAGLDAGATVHVRPL